MYVMSSKARELAWSHYEETMELPRERCKEQFQAHAGDEDHARPGWTTLIHGQDPSWNSQSE